MNVLAKLSIQPRNRGSVACQVYNKYTQAMSKGKVISMPACTSEAH